MIEEIYQQLCATPSDINENLPVLKKYAEQSDIIVELGVRAVVSTWALLAGKPRMLFSVDIERPEMYGVSVWDIIDAANKQDTLFTFLHKSSLEVDLPEHDFLFIDTLHTYDQLTTELNKHHSKVRKFIAMHDTAIPDLPEMRQAVNDFLDAHPEWEVAEYHENNNGMTILQRV